MYWLATGMAEVMQKNNGVGLAAPQVGEMVNLIVGGHECVPWAFAIINPVLVKTSRQIFSSKEGCLSFPGQTALVTRRKQITVEGFDLDWNPIKFKARGLLAACLQHEMDHLLGRCIVGKEVI